jgi:vitamin B12 transporter
MSIQMNKHCFGFILTALPLLSVAQEQFSTEEITVSVSRTERSLLGVSASVEVLDADDLSAYRNFSLIDVLGQLTGLSISNSGGPGKQSTLRIRGEEGYRTRVLIDGVEVSDVSSTQIQAQLEHYLAAGVERVEVLRGPQGMMYGADAGGVLNIVTSRSGEELSGELNISYGADETSNLNASAAGRWLRIGYSLQVAEMNSQGFNASKLDTLRPDDDGYTNQTAGINLSYELNDSWQLLGGYQQIDSETEFDGCFGLAGSSHDCLSTFRQNNLHLKLEGSSSTFRQQLAWHHSRSGRSTYTDALPLLQTQGQLEQMLYLGDYQITDQRAVLIGFDLQRARLEEATELHERGQQAIFAEWRDRLGSAFYYSAGIRHDDNDDFGIHDSYRLGLVYLLDLPAGSLKFKANAGNGFRAPSLYELAYNRGAFAYPPASLHALQEERSRGWDAGIEISSDTGKTLEIVYFKQAIQDAIEFDLATFSGYLQRSGSSQAQGLELAYRQALPAGLELSINYTYTDTQDALGRQRIRRPGQQSNLTLSYHSPQQRLRLLLSWQQRADVVDEYYDPASFSNTRTELADFQVVNVHASFELFKRLNLSLRINNLFNQNYQEVFNYNVAGRSIYVGARFLF